MSLAFRRTLILVLVLCCALGGGRVQGALPPTEYQVKAAYLFNFGQFVEWPASSFASPGAPFVIGILGDDPFGGTLDDVVRGEALGGHPLQVRRFQDGDDVSACNILFIARTEAARLERTLQAVRGRNVLTVTDWAGEESHDAIIVLKTENKRIRMRINVAAARANNLVISSKLLRPAEVVGAEAT
jgi:hypothetical protein